ncbi:Multidrug resistance protein MdtA precursor [Phycisphaerae bacterium RAS1]|nr:Multidrug resistance protein MdtA precursor [Phycisphaerae bacterium RAS1]
MSVSPEVRQRLSTLTIPKEQRPAPQATQRRSGWFAALLVIVLVGGGGAAAYRYRAPLLTLLTASQDAPRVRTLVVARRSGDEQSPVLTATGKIVSDHRVQVVTKVSGQIVELRFEQGDRVEKGQVLARIEDVNYRTRRDEALATLARSTANLEYQKTNYPRVQRMHADKSASDIELADARRWHDEAVAQVKADQAALAFWEKQLADCQVVAPIAGVVLERNVEVGDFVAAEGGRGANANAQFAAIADMSKLRVEVDVSELDISRLSANLPCVVAPDAYKERKFAGHVMWIDPGANYAKATVQVKVRIEEPDDFLRVEGAAQVSFLTESRGGSESQPATIWIPTGAVLEKDGQARVFVVRAERAVEGVVRLGRRSSAQVEVLSGLNEGDQIVAEGLDKLRDGQRIKP